MQVGTTKHFALSIRHNDTNRTYTLEFVKELEVKVVDDRMSSKFDGIIKYDALESGYWGINIYINSQKNKSIGCIKIGFPNFLHIVEEGFIGICDFESRFADEKHFFKNKKDEEITHVVSSYQKTFSDLQNSLDLMQQSLDLAQEKLSFLRKTRDISEY